MPGFGLLALNLGEDFGALGCGSRIMVFRAFWFGIQESGPRPHD